MNIQTNQLSNVVTPCILDLDYDQFIAILDLSLELVLLC